MPHSVQVLHEYQNDGEGGAGRGGGREIVTIESRFIQSYHCLKVAEEY